MVCERFAGGFPGGLRAVLRAVWIGRLRGGLRRLAGGLWGFAVDGYRADDWRVCGWFVVCGRFAGGLRAVYGRFAVDGLRTDCWRVCGQFAVCGRFAGGFAGGLPDGFAGGLRLADCGRFMGGTRAVSARFASWRVCGLRLVVIIT